MADNSKRELILEAIVVNLEEIPSVNKVQRMLPAFVDLANISSAHLPLIAVVGGLPSPVQKISGRTSGDADAFISSLEVGMTTYAMDNEEPDSTISSLADDIWAKIYSDQVLVTSDYPKGLALGVSVMPKVEVGRWAPYVIFKFVCSYKYYHGTGGI